MKISFRAIGAVVCLTLVVGFATPQDGLGKKRGGGGSSGGNSGGAGSGNGNSGGSGGGLGRVDRGGGRTDGGGSRGNGGGGSTIGGGGNRNGGGSTIGGGSGNRGGGVVISPNGQGRGNGATNQSPAGLGRIIRQSRSGKVNYGSKNNFHIDKSGFKIDRGGFGIFGQLDRKINRSESRVGIVYGRYHGRPWGYRVGYYHWNNDWRDDYFWYPHYIFDPYSYNRFVCSPWYYYSFLPPYLNTTRIIVVNNYYGYQNWTGDRYNWQRPSSYDRYDRDRELDFVLDDIVNAFERSDRRAINRLIPRSGSIAIYLDGQYNYSLNPDDFYDLYMDAIENSRTRSYEVEDVRVNRGVARVTARHEYTDSWGGREVVYHDYTLEQDRGGYVIREFGTSNARR